MISLAPFSFLKIILVIQGLLSSIHTVKFFVLLRWKIPLVIDRDSIGSGSLLWGRIVTFTVVILPIQEHGISLHICVIFYFFYQGLIVLCMQVFCLFG